ncbi:MAG: hypothetical protein J0G30_04595 [Actinomycetales bacterium]|nr:hypothetical protein [Actinomycetales bacterium]
MRTLRDRLMRLAQPEAGLSIVEVLVAVMVFMIVSVGIAYGTIASLRLSRDAQSREVATNLAATEIDVVRQIGDPLAVVDASSTASVDGISYTVARTAKWVDSAGNASSCGVGGAPLKYKAVNVTVSWSGQLAGNLSISSDTILAPESRLNDPDAGTLLVRVVGADGLPRSGVAVSASPTSGGAAVSLPATDAQGCSFAFQVVPGTYTVGVSRGGYISDKQQSAPTVSSVVTAGTSTSQSFQYDQAGTFALSYQVAGSTGSLRLPSDLDLSFLNSYGVYVRSGGSPSSVSLHPYPSGYSVVAGAYAAPTDSSAGCVAPDPGSWPAGTVGGTAYAAGERQPAQAAAPGGSASVTVPMGGLVVGSANGYQFRATVVAPPSGTGDPGCATTKTYTFDMLTDDGTATLALPYGSWKIEARKFSPYWWGGGSWSSWGKPSGGLVSGTLSSLGQLLGTSGGSDLIVTLDPRKPSS